MRHREAEPLLAEGDATAELASLWSRTDASGTAVFRDGRMAGYLLGAPREDPLSGANVWVESAGHAADVAEDVRDLYAVAAARWVEEGRTRHWALVPATDDTLVDAWFRLGFGHQQAHAVREVSAEVEVSVPKGWSIGAPSLADFDDLFEIDFALPAHQRASPVFTEQPLPSRDDSRREWEATVADPDEQVFVGYRGETPLAAFSVVPSRLSRHYTGLMHVENACYLGFAATVPAARGSGIGVALTQSAIQWAAQAGYRAMVTDWRVTNLLSSRFWPARGFRPTFFRLYRAIP